MPGKDEPVEIFRPELRAKALGWSVLAEKANAAVAVSQGHVPQAGAGRPAGRAKRAETASAIAEPPGRVGGGA